MYSKLENNFVLRLKQQLNQDNLPTLPIILHENKAVIAGSYVLQSICEASWANDIDIWCVNPDTNKLLNTFYELGYKIVDFRTIDTREGIKTKKLKIIDDILKDEEKLITAEYRKQVEEKREEILTERINDQTIDHIENYRRLMQHIKNIYYLKSANKPLIQIMICNESILDCINSFDINVCQTYYDGEDIYVKDKGIFMKSITTKKAFITKEACEIQSPVEWIRTLKRAMKYTDRGFFIDFENGYDIIKNNARDIDFVYNWNRQLFSYKKLELFPYGGMRYKLKKVKPNLFLKTTKIPYFNVYDQNLRLLSFGYENKVIFSVNDVEIESNLVLVQYIDDEI